MSPAALPRMFCWTRFGMEAGEPIDRILARKECERRANAGVFYWGIGNSVAPGLAELLKRCEHPEVLFSPIKTRPRAVDAAPQHVVRWRAGETVAGERIELPAATVVTSRAAHPASPGPHYALVCTTEEPLRLVERGRLRMADLQNLHTGNPVGSSQVTAVVRRRTARSGGSKPIYTVALRAELTAPYFIRLEDPIPVDQNPSVRAEAA